MRKVYVMVKCQYFKIGMTSLVGSSSSLQFIKKIGEVNFAESDHEPLYILLVLDMSSAQSLKDFKESIDLLNQFNFPRKIGVLVSQYNSYLTYYIHHKLKGKVTFFNAHNLQSGLFLKNFNSWLKGKTFQPMRMVARYRDVKYGFSLKEWVSLIIPLSGESIREISSTIKVSPHALYQTRQKAIRKIGMKSYREFCGLYINGTIKTESGNAVRKRKK